MARELKRNTLKNGFYIEVCSMGSRQGGIRIASETFEEMMRQQEVYKPSKYVIIWGEHKEGKWLSEKKLPAEPGETRQKKTKV